MDMIVSAVVLTFAMLRANDRSVVLLSANKAKQQQKIMTSEIAGVFCVSSCTLPLTYALFTRFHLIDLGGSSKQASERELHCGQ